MGRRAALLLLGAVLGLLTVGVGLSFRLLAAVSQAARSGTTGELRAIGLTASRALSRGAGDGLLADLRRDSQLEDAYLLDGALRPIGPAGAAAAAGGKSLLRIDPDRALLALRGEPSVGPAYQLPAPPAEELPPLPPGGSAPALAPPPSDPSPEILAGYFPVARPGGVTQLLVLEAGPAFVAAPRRLRAAAWGATAAAAALALLFALSILLAVRAAGRERRLYGQAEHGRAITQMAAMVAHEIRNPLGTIRAGAELLREQGPRGAAFDIADDLLSEVERMRRLTEEFLSLSRDPPLQLGPVDLGALCDDIAAQMERRFGEKDGEGGGGLTVVRGGEAHLTVTGDEDKLRQVLLNLCLNAAQALAGAGRLELHLARASGGATIVVSDDGPGIEEPLSRRLFEPFVTSKQGGTGLGLVLSRRIAERHGGALELLPPGDGRRGARFALRLPRRPPPSA